MTIGQFEYIHCRADYYPIGISQFVKDNYSLLIASTEKALCNMVVFTPKLRPGFIKSMFIPLNYYTSSQITYTAKSMHPVDR